MVCRSRRRRQQKQRQPAGDCRRGRGTISWPEESSRSNSRRVGRRKRCMSIGRITKPSRVFRWFGSSRDSRRYEGELVRPSRVEVASSSNRSIRMPPNLRDSTYRLISTSRTNRSQLVQRYRFPMHILVRVILPGNDARRMD